MEREKGLETDQARLNNYATTRSFPEIQSSSHGVPFRVRVQSRPLAAG